MHSLAFFLYVFTAHSHKITTYRSFTMLLCILNNLQFQTHGVTHCLVTHSYVVLIKHIKTNKWRHTQTNWVSQWFIFTNFAFSVAFKDKPPTIMPSSDWYKIWVHPGQFHYKIPPATINVNSAHLIFRHSYYIIFFFNFSSLSIFYLFLSILHASQYNT